MPDDLQLPPPQPPGDRYAIKVLPPATVGQLQESAGRTDQLATLLFGLSLAIVLPLDAVIAPRDGSEPVVQVEPLTFVGAQAVGAVLGRPAIAVSSGHVLLGQVDRRMAGLVARLDAYRVPDVPSALASTGLVTDLEEMPPSVGFRATPRALWELAKELHTQGGQHFEPVDGLGRTRS